MDKSKFKADDIVEVYFPPAHHCFSWTGLRLKVMKTPKNDRVSIEVIVVRAIAAQPNYPVGFEFNWGGQNALRAFQDNGSPNQIYVDHMFERLTKNATPSELKDLAERLFTASETQD